jgi:hypothetical protein
MATLSNHFKASSCLLAASVGATSVAAATEVLVPAYFYPAGADNGWPAMTSAASQVAITAILNPASGPGTAIDPTYTGVVNTFRGAGGRVIGYVSTSYASRPIADVITDINRYRTFYNIDGFFLDEMTSSSASGDISYYSQLHNYIKGLNPGYRVVTNPGINVPQGYFSAPVADTICTFEHFSGYSTWSPASFTASYSPRRSANLPYEIATSSAMTTAINYANSKRVGYVYVTDDTGANPWDRLPTYWTDEISSIRAITPTWKAAGGSGDWNLASNWTSAVPNAVGAEAMFLGAIASPQTIYTNNAVSVGALVFNNSSRYVIAGAGTLSLDVSVDQALIDVRRGSHSINVPTVFRANANVLIGSQSALTFGDPVTIKAGRVVAKLGSMFINAPLILESGASLVSQGGSIGLLSAPSIGPGANMDLGDSTCEINYAGDSPANLIYRQLASAYANGLWNSEGIGTSQAVPRSMGLGWMDDAQQRKITIHLAHYGDANLSGSVDSLDFNAFASGYGSTSHTIWANGDFNYDQKVNSLDFNLLAGNYAAAPSLGAIVPEPSTIGCLLPLLASIRRRMSSAR